MKGFNSNTCCALYIADLCIILWYNISSRQHESGERYRKKSRLTGLLINTITVKLLIFAAELNLLIYLRHQYHQIKIASNACDLNNYYVQKYLQIQPILIAVNNNYVLQNKICQIKTQQILVVGL